MTDETGAQTLPIPTIDEAIASAKAEVDRLKQEKQADLRRQLVAAEQAHAALCKASQKADVAAKQAHKNEAEGLAAVNRLKKALGMRIRAAKETVEVQASEQPTPPHNEASRDSGAPGEEA